MIKKNVGSKMRGGGDEVESIQVNVSRVQC